MNEKIEFSLPKTDFLKGSLQVETKRCGRPNCRCARGYLHGPYFYRHWRQDGRQKKAYVRQENVAEMLSAIARRQLWIEKWWTYGNNFCGASRRDLWTLGIKRTNSAQLTDPGKGHSAGRFSISTVYLPRCRAIIAPVLNVWICALCPSV